jgi:hypothetical protein
VAEVGRRRLAVVAQGAALGAAMGEKLRAAEPCIPLRRAELTWRDRHWRLLRLGTHACLAKALGPVLPLEWILHRACRAVCGQVGGFALPTPLALAHFGDILLIDVPTASVQLRLPDWVGCGTARLHLSDCFIGGGNWRKIAQPVAGSSVFAEARELAEHGLDYRRTRAFINYLEGAQAGKPMTRNGVRLDSSALVEGYFERFVALFRSIEKCGVRRLAAVRNGGPETACPPLIRGWAKEWGEREIGIAIGETGEIYRLPGGQHRTAIAIVLGVEALPVQIRLIHAQWLRQALGATGGDFIAAIKGGIAQLAVPQEGARRA